MSKWLILLLIAFLAVLWIGGDKTLESPQTSPDSLIQLKHALIQGNSLLPITGIIETKVVATVTAYNPVPEQTDSNPEIMASGNYVYEGAIACPTYLSFGTLVVIDKKIYVCEDRTHPKNDGIFDILMFSLQEAKDWGSPTKEVTILTI